MFSSVSRLRSLGMVAVVLGDFMNIKINEFVQFGHAKHFYQAYSI